MNTDRKIKHMEDMQYLGERLCDFLKAHNPNPYVAIGAMMLIVNDILKREGVDIKLMGDYMDAFTIMLNNLKKRKMAENE